MENASKALIMAGEVLISIIIISALVLMFNSLTSYQNVKAQNDREAEVIKFNNKYEAYNIDDVRGNELYSLINQVVNYNERKSTVGEEGKELAYQPITINVNLKSVDGKDKKQFAASDGELRLFDKITGNELKINVTNNTFKELFIPLIKIEAEHSARLLNNLVIASTKIFIDNNEFDEYLYNDINKAKQIIYNFNSAYGSPIYSADNDDAIKASWNDINQKYKEDVYTYHEYLQFTRSHFKCIGVKYNEGTGRIVEMNFQFTGEIN